MSNTLLSSPHREVLVPLRNALLNLHQGLVTIERHFYEQRYGRVSSGELLQLVIYNDQFAWLHPVSELVVRIDDLLRDDEPIAADVIQAVDAEVRSLLTPAADAVGFAGHYDAALQGDPDTILAHAAVFEALSQLQPTA